jgi:diacylglycerol kinase (ATP)
MKRNRPQYNLFKNTTYALKGLLDIIKNEHSFKIELFFAVILLPFIYLIDLPLGNKLLMFLTLMSVLMAEVVNSAIERVVDLVTMEHHDMAGRAKDVGSTIVLFSIITFIVVWLVILLPFIRG